jgi:phosphoribosyl-ATP pyrophosphohydrolase
VATSPAAPPEAVLERLARTIASRLGADPRTSYVAALVAKGDDAILKKIGEEATEVVMAGKGADDEHLVREVADLWFHCLVLLAHRGRSPDEVMAELARREGVSGLAEKASRGG